MSKCKFTLLASAMTIALCAQTAQAQTNGSKPAGDADQAGSSTSDEILVTARRASENIQNVPVSIVALGSEQLRSAGITKVSEIASVVPGLNLFFNGSVSNSIFSIRGMSRGSLGFQQPAVTTYVNDVPTTVNGASPPTFDVVNIQVLKGPQGTLFGRNSEAGAILVNTREPSYDFSGYASMLVGSYSWIKAEAAVNFPIIADRLAVRVAGVVNERDGYTKNLSFAGQDFNDISNNSLRISVLAQPFDGVKNVFVYERLRSSTHGVTPVLLSYSSLASGLPNSFAALPPFIGYPAGSSGNLTPYNQIAALAAAAFTAQQANGARTATAPYLMPAVDRRDTFSNTTTIDLGGVTIKNVFGYSDAYVSAYVNQGGFNYPLIPGFRYINYAQLTNELQLSGKALNGALTYILGGFFLDYRPSGNSFVSVGTPGTLDFTKPQYSPGPPPTFSPILSPLGSSDYYHEQSKSVFGQVNLSLGKLTSALEGVSVDAGLRYSKDNHKLCSVLGQFPQSAASESSCLATPANNASSSEDSWSYTLGLNYQVSENVLLYGVTRKGYRAGGLNAPILGGTLKLFQSFGPEKVTDFEIGLKSRFDVAGMPVTFNAALFQANYKNLQYAVNTNGINQILVSSGGVDGDFNSANNPNPLFYANVGDGRVKGLEASLSVRPVRSLQLSGGLSILDKQITKNTFAAPANFALLPPGAAPGIASFTSTVFYGAPDLSYNGSIAYTLPIPSTVGEMVVRAKVTGSGTVKYDGIVVPPKAILDLRFEWNSVLGSDVDLAAFATNVTKKLYVAAPGLGTAGAFAFSSGIYNEPRIFGLEVRFHFGPQ